MVFICFAVYVLANNTRVVPYFNRRVWPPGGLKIWYNPCIIRQYIHGKTNENHVLFSNYFQNKKIHLIFIPCFIGAVGHIIITYAWNQEDLEGSHNANLISGFNGLLFNNTMRLCPMYICKHDMVHRGQSRHFSELSYWYCH